MSLSRNILAGLVASFVAGLGQPVESATLTIGSIAEDIREEIEDFQEIVSYLDARAGELGVDGVSFHVDTTSQSMAESLREGRVDIYVDSPIVGALIGRASGAKPFLRRWKKGVAEYHSLIVTRDDSDIETIEDLRGKIIAFDDPFSSSGYLLPKAMLLERGLKMVEVLDADHPVADDKVGYIFASDDNNIVYWVLKGKVAAGATSPKVLAKFEKKKPGTFRVVSRSADIPRHVLLHGPDVPEATLAALREILLDMENHPEGQMALRKFQKTKKFDDFPGGAAATFEPIERMLDLLANELND